MDGSHTVILAGSIEDLAGIHEIYNYYVLTSAATFDIEPRTLEWRQEWFAKYADVGRYRLLVARDGDRVAGYATSSPYRSKAAYEPSVETSVYLAPDRAGGGIGAALYRKLFSELEREDVHRAYAGIALPNPASVRLHERFGFRRVGYFHEQGRKFGRLWDVAWYERRLS